MTFSCNSDSGNFEGLGTSAMFGVSTAMFGRTTLGPRTDHAWFFFDSSTRLLTGCPLQSSEFSSTLINPITQLPNRSYLSPMTQYIFWGAVRMSTELQVGTDHICLYIFSLALCSKQGHTSQHHAPGEGNRELGPIRHPSSTTVAWPVQKGS